jgi:glutamine synthetase
MDDQEILQYVKNHTSGKVKIAITDIDGILRGKYISVEKFLSVGESGTGFCDVIFGWDANDAAYDNGKFTGWHTGYPDAAARLDLSTFRKIPWENDTLFSGELIPEKKTFVCPRSLLKKVLSMVCLILPFSRRNLNGIIIRRPAVFMKNNSGIKPLHRACLVIRY